MLVRDPSSQDTLERDLLSIANHFPNRYLLSFQPHEPTPGLHLLRLTLPGRPGLVVNTRETYWRGQP